MARLMIEIVTALGTPSSRQLNKFVSEFVYFLTACSSNMQEERYLN